ncbi:protein phosphatase 2C domain-containing protein [Nocardioides sp. cx-173]|uniref:protein phosphatase 2C domain-containing protein n=1 Tax=Nocardioides sp. cx-173 TaxID=2898796 RepID=UPI001E616622|nr:protein phosphatase 2C domain-containing protein [Nocardioides sp. cx-173]MCD4524688.1 protein phosphatase 2C domain-containing protein [Nocardioides sp. cx-173]UGB43198.1 protein phosphatase 2C domain-containing protein [Nocardioides sp. cx-173]
MTDAPCPSCGSAMPAGTLFCEHCGASLGAAPVAEGARPVSLQGAVAPGASTPIDDVAPISAATHATGGAAVATAPGRVPCRSCGGVVGPDGYCEQCGTKAPSERDHFREAPADWVAGVCDRGIRHSRNEDAMALLASPTPGERAVLLVLDGVSNTDDSHLASLAGARAAREVLRTPLPQGMGTPESRLAAVTKVFSEAVLAANEAVVATTPAGSPNPPSATFVCVVVEGSMLSFANLGDSRAYWLPDGASGVQLSVDDSVAQQLIAAGTPRQQAETSAQAHAITKWLGRDARDLTPRVGQLEVTGPGWVLVCSDGLWNYASEPDALVAQVAASGATAPDALALALTDWANAQGGIDNITVTLARLDGPPAGHNAAQSAVPQEETHG